MSAPRTGEIAGLGKRLLSLFYEALLLAALALAGSFPLLFVTDVLDPALRRPLHQLYLVLLSGSYFVWQWTGAGQTLAMKTWRLRLVNGDGGPPTLRQAVCRFLAALAGLALLGGGFLWALFDREGQFLHDRLAGTRIVIER